MKVSELAKVAKVSCDAVRHNLRLGLINADKDHVNGYHYFSEKTLGRTWFTKLAQGLGFKLQDIQVIFQHASKGRSPCPQVRALIQQRLAENESKLHELTLLFNRMQKALLKWKTMPDGMLDGDSICQLIESHGLDEQVNTDK